MTNILTISPQKRYLKGAATFSVMTCSIMTLGIMDSITTIIIKNTQHNNVYLVLIFNCYAVCCFADCHYADCHYADCRYADCHFSECHGTFNHQLDHTYEKESLAWTNLVRC
jgi:hypothetical protein